MEFGLHFPFITWFYRAWKNLIQQFLSLFKVFILFILRIIVFINCPLFLLVIFLSGSISRSLILQTDGLWLSSRSSDLGWSSLSKKSLLLLWLSLSDSSLLDSVATNGATDSTGGFILTGDLICLFLGLPLFWKRRHRQTLFKEGISISGCKIGGSCSSLEKDCKEKTLEAGIFKVLLGGPSSWGISLDLGSPLWAYKYQDKRPTRDTHTGG